MTAGGPASGTLVPPAPADAVTVFGRRLSLAQEYCGLLAHEGTERGLIGPREIARLWERHLLNSAALAELIPQDARVVDVGSGAGLPGIPLALCRPDVHVDLVESLLRRTVFLTEVRDRLGLIDQVRVIKGRAEDASTIAEVGNADWVTARAVAPLDRLVRWCLPLLRPGGYLLAIKGATVFNEVERFEAVTRASGVDDVDVRQIGATLGEPTWVVRVRRSMSRSGAHGRSGVSRRQKVRKGNQ